MESNFPIKDLQRIWQGQPTEPLRMSVAELHHRALQRPPRVDLKRISQSSSASSVAYFWAGPSRCSHHTRSDRLGSA